MTSPDTPCDMPISANSDRVGDEMGEREEEEGGPNKKKRAKENSGISILQECNPKSPAKKK